MTGKSGSVCCVVLAQAIACMTSVAANAQGDDQPVIIVSAAGIAQDRDETGQAVTVIDSTEIDKSQARTVAELLQQVPSVRVNANGGTGTVTGVSLRGSENGQVLVLLDGVRVNDPSSTNDAVDFGNLLTGNIRRIEVMRGSNAVPYGSEAMGGVINLSTRDPDAPQGLSLNASLEGGFANSALGQLDAGWRDGALRVDAGVAALRTDGISSADPRFGASEKDGLENITAHVRIETPLADGVTLDLRGYGVTARLEYDSFFGAPMDSADTSDFQQLTGYAGLGLVALDGALENHFSLTWLTNGRDYRFSPGQPVDFGFRGQDLRLEYRARLTGAEPADLLFGYSHETPQYRFFGFGSDEVHEATSDGAFALLLLRPGQELSLSGGIRHTSHSEFGAVTTFGLNANWGLSDGKTRLRAAFGEGFRAPSLYQLYDSFSGNRLLRPERSASYDIGMDRTIADGKGRIAATLFLRHTSNQIDFDFATFRFANLARTRARGLEVEGSLGIGKDHEFTLAYSLVDTRDRAPGSPRFGERLPRQPVHGLWASVDKVWQSGAQAGVSLRLASSALDPATADGLEGYVLLTLRASVPLDERLELFGRVENLFDAHSVTAYGYNSMPRAAYAGVRVSL